MSHDRDELCRELVGVIRGNKPIIDNTINVNAIADFILQRERRMLEEIEKPLITAQGKHSKIKAVVSQHAFDFCDIGVLIDRSLSIIQSKLEGK